MLGSNYIYNDIYITGGAAIIMSGGFNNYSLDSNLNPQNTTLKIFLKLETNWKHADINLYDSDNLPVAHVLQSDLNGSQVWDYFEARFSLNESYWITLRKHETFESVIGVLHRVYLGYHG